MLKKYPISSLKLWLVFISIGVYTGSVTPGNEKINTTENHRLITNKQLTDWKKLIVDNENRSILTRLQKTNDFFNQFTYLHDDVFLGETDDWKTPYEFILDQGGDSEDFSVAKYFTLLAMKVPAKKLKISYVKSGQLNQAHIVLSYYPTDDADPLILDNLEHKILPASERNDLVPIYNFDGKKLWLSKHQNLDHLFPGFFPYRIKVTHL